MGMFIFSQLYAEILAFIIFTGIIPGYAWAEKASKPGERYTCIIMVGFRAVLFLFLVPLGLIFWDMIVKQLFFGVFGYGNIMHWLGIAIVLGIVGTEFIMAAALVAPSRKAIATLIVMIITFVYLVEIYYPATGYFVETRTVLNVIFYTAGAGFICQAFLAIIHGIYLKARHSEKRDTPLWDISSGFKRVFSLKTNILLWLLVLGDFMLSYEGYGLLSYLSLDAFLGILIGATGGITIFVIARIMHARTKLLRDEWAGEHFAQTDKLVRLEEPITMSDGEVLQGFIYKSALSPGERDSREQAPGPAILFLHGFGGFAQDLNFEPMLSSFAMAGYTVFAYDYRWSGHSRKEGQEGPLQGVLKEGVVLFEKMIGDAATALDWVISHKDVVDPARIAVIGFSLGSLIGLSRSIYQDPRVKLIITGCSMHDLGETVVRILHSTWYLRFLGPIITSVIKRNTKMGMQELLVRSKKISPSITLNEQKDGLLPNNQRVFLAHCKDDKIMDFETTFVKNKAALALPDANCIVFETGGHEFKHDELALGAWVFQLLHYRL
ncbi:MAG TPA: alpha/beta fold hydrolase [Candidatus Lokiarchaeia archaeon]|nr:alpha/beta fold hydrolase [Candidatus Lokiarchaeia archaeon]